MKKTEPKKVTICKFDFYIYPFSAFKAANLSGELGSLVIPFLPLLAKTNGNLLDLEFDTIAPALSGAMSSISGDKVESLIRKLILDENVAVTIKGETEYLDEEIVDEIFCGDIFNLYKLVWEVLKVNYSGFFGMLGHQSGGVTET